MFLFNSKIGHLFTRVISLESRGLATPFFANGRWESSFLRLSELANRFLKTFEMSTDKMILKPPDSVRGMTQMDKEAFKLVVKVPVLEVNVKYLRPILQLLKPYFLKLVQFNNVEDTADTTTKRIILDPDKINIDGSSTFTETENESLKPFDLGREKLEWKEITINYDNWKYETILKSVLPSGVEGASSYSRVGHIVHLNLRDHLIDYRFVIGQVLLDKLNGVSLVVNKTNVIESTYRNFKMEIIAGAGSTVTTVKENSRTYTFDFANVYWNPRLSTEHERLVKCIQRNDLLFDVFAGVGPFAVPAAKKNCKVFANDLNPESYKWLCVNVKKNKVESVVKSFNMDGKDFIENVFKDEVVNLWTNFSNELYAKRTVHVAMNLPASALEFLPLFNGLFRNFGASLCEDKISPIRLHVYFFVKGEEIENDAKKLVRETLSLSESVVLEYVYVRNVATTKHMVRCSFFVPFDVLFNKKKCLSSESDAESDPVAKKICLEMDK